MNAEHELEGQVALVTGGGRGIGAGIARELADGGARVAVAARTRDQVEQVAREIDGLALELDVTDQAAVERNGEVRDTDQRQTRSVARPRRAAVDRSIQADLRSDVDGLVIARVHFHDVDRHVGKGRRTKAVHG